MKFIRAFTFLAPIYLIFSFALITQAQSLQFVRIDSAMFSDDINKDFSSHIHVENSTMNEVEFKVRKTNESAASGHDISVCVGINCYPPSVDTTPNSITLAAGAIDSSFYGSLYPNGFAGNSEVDFCFFIEGGLPDEICANVKYEVSDEVSVAFIQRDEVKAYPNPTSAYLFVDGIQVGDKLQVISLDGRTTLETEAGMYRTDLSSLTAGNYLVRISRDDKLIYSSKLLKK